MYPHHVFHAELVDDLHQTRMRATTRARAPEHATRQRRHTRRRHPGHRLRPAGMRSG
jgi:hypothetical protein